jgi:hypothetical protein
MYAMDPISDETAIRAAAEDYAASWFAGDPTRMDRCLHPALAKRRVDGSRSNLVDISKDEMVEAAATPRLSGGEFEIDVLAVDDDVASASVRTEPFVDLLHLARFDDRWLIVNALWEPASSAPPTQTSDADIARALDEYATFIPDRDVRRAIRCHHPALRERRPIGNGLGLEETSYEEVLAIARDGFEEEPASWGATSEVLDRTGTVASSRMDVAWFQIHLHLAAFADGWRIVNILYRLKEDG